MGNTVSAVIASGETGAEAPKKDETASEAWRPAGFTGTQEDLAKSWADQRAEVTRLQQAAAAGKKTETPAPKPIDATIPPAPKADDPAVKDPAEGKTETPDDAAQKVLTDAGVDITSYQTEYDTTGDVSPEKREALAKSLEKALGPNARQLVDDYIESKKVVHANDYNMYMDAAGGADQYQAMVNWAAETLTPEQKDVFNRQVNSRDRAAALFAIEGLRAKYEAQNGRAPRLIQATGAAPAGTKGFASVQEMTSAMRDPRYKTDPAFREQVTQRLAVSNF